MIINTNGITIKQLKEYIKDWPEVNQNEEENIIWLGTDQMTSFDVCVSVCKLNNFDIYLGKSY